MKLTLNPITEIKITDLVKTTIENLTKNSAINSQPLLWVDGVLFFVLEYDNEELRLEASKGTLYLDTVMYAESPKIEHSKINGWNVDVLNVTGVKTFEGLIECMKLQYA